MTRHEQLERDLRATAARFDHVPISPDAWQENVRRVDTASRRRLRWPDVIAVAAAVVLVLLVGGALLSGTGPDDGMPAGGSKGGDPWAAENVLGEPVDAETLTVDGSTAVHQIVLTDTTGDGPDLCDRWVADQSASGGCTHRDPQADDPSVAFDWLSGGEGGSLTGVAAGVDARVGKVQIWMSNGDMVLAQLHPTGWDDTKMFALAVQGDAPVPQRLVAYADATGTVLQTVDLVDRFGDEWLAAGPACAGQARWPQPGTDGPSDVLVRLGSSDAMISVARPGDQNVQTCPDLRNGALAAWFDAGPPLVVVVGPEVVDVQVRSGDTVLDRAKAAPTRGSPYQVAVLRNVRKMRGLDLVAVDVTGRVLQRTPLLATSPAVS